MTSPRVLFIAPQPFFASRGSPLRVRSTVSAIAELGYLVDLLVLPLGEDTEILGVNVHRSFRIPGVRSIPIGPSWTKIVWDVSISLKALQLVRRTPYKVIHGIEEGGLIAALLARWKKIPYVFDMHSQMSLQLETSGFLRRRWLLDAFRRIESACIRRSAGVITVGDELVSTVQQVANGVPTCALQDLPLDGVDCVDGEQLQELRERFGKDGRKILVYTGNFESYQGIDLLFGAFAGACAQRDDLLLLLVGGGSGSLAHVNRYRQMSRELGIEHAVVFTGERPPEEMAAFMALADLLVSPRIAGNNPPLKIYSYMAAGKPIVATRMSAHTQVLDDSSAYLAALTPEDMCASILSALDARGGAERQARVLRAQELSEGRFSRAEFRRRISELYSPFQNSCDSTLSHKV